MRKWIRRIAVIILLMVFVFSATFIGVTYYQYRENDRRYEEIADRYTMQMSDLTVAQDPPDTGISTREEKITAPIVVDFEALGELNEDIIGWIYCEGTMINYPVLHGEDNDKYLRHSYDGSYNMAGSIFVEAANSSNFTDANTIIYGHHMKNGSMFAGLDQWTDQEFYEEHPVMWLITPGQDYRIDLFSAYTTSAYSDTYTIYTQAGEGLEGYLDGCVGRSAVSADMDLDGAAHYVVLSTCAYVFEDARNVVHGRLVPVDSAGGIPR